MSDLDMDEATTDDEDRSFWMSIVAPDGVWDHDQVMRELHDYKMLLEGVPKVYDHVTGGRVSKPNTDALAVIGEAEEYIQRVVRDEVREMLEEVEHVWVCSACGPCKRNRQTWCDLGCGRDYNHMTEMALVIL